MHGKTVLWLVEGVLFMVTAAYAGDLPDPMMTPGALNPNVTQETLYDTVCVSEYSTSIRPPEKYTYQMKRKQVRAYGYGFVRLREFEEDHLVPLSLGGHPTDPRNLWPQKWEGEWGAKKKDVLERVLWRAVCAGDVPLAEAQQAIASNWIAAYQRYVPAFPQYARPWKKAAKNR